MEEMTNYRFRAWIEYDLPSYQEINKLLMRRSGRYMASLILLMVLTSLYIYFFGIVQQTSITWICILLILAFFWGRYLFQACRSRDGGLDYKRMLSVNNGLTPRQELCFSEDSIHTHNVHTGSSAATGYSQLQAIYETEHFLIFIHELNLYSAIRKDSITGGTKEELLSFLFEKGTGIKKKKLSGILPGKIVWVSFIIFSVLGALLALWLSSPVQSFLHRQQPVNNYMSYQAIAQELEDLGITGIDDALIAELEAYDLEYDYSYSYNVGNKALDMLCWAGMGEYDPDTWSWTPSDSGVYWFDMEVMNLDTMYTDFLNGIRALDPQKLNFTGIKEDLLWEDVKEGIGTQRVSFDWNGASYTLDADVMYDWFDITVASDLADLVQAQNTGSLLYFAYDGGQGILVFYNTPQWCTKFEKATGIQLHDDPMSILYAIS